MALFRRKAGPDPQAAIRDFWTWWSGEGAATCAAAIGERRPERIADDLAARVRAISPGLAWELGAGDVSEHRLVVSPEGDPQLRALARRWLLAAPPADATWSYDDHRGPAADLEGTTLRVADGPEISFGDVVVGARRAGSRIDVTVHHPAFGAMPEQARLQVAFLALDAALGENDTELWVGEIATATQPPMDAFGLAALRALVADVRREALDDDGRPSWTLLRGEGPQGPVIAMAMSPLHPLLAPTLTRYVSAEVPYADRADGDLPAPASLDALRELEDRLTGALGADGMLVGHQTAAGARLFHLYVDPETDAVDRVARALDDWPAGHVQVRVADGDAGWEAVRHLRG